MDTPIFRSEYIITSPYGQRKHPITGVQSFHYGIDIVPKNNAGAIEVYPIAPGIVVDIYDGIPGYSEDQAKGNYVRIAHSSGRESLYLHLQEGIYVSIGQKVYRDTMIGIMGSTGRSTGPHVHFQVYDRNGSTLDPAVFLSALSINAVSLDEYIEIRCCSYGDISQDVVALQRALSRISPAIQTIIQESGYSDGAYDGIYGQGLKKAVAAYQRLIGLPETGEADATTVALLNRYIGKH